jgi:hypothetical protein
MALTVQKIIIVAQSSHFERTKMGERSVIAHLHLDFLINLTHARRIDR